MPDVKRATEIGVPIKIGTNTVALNIVKRCCKDNKNNFILSPYNFNYKIVKTLDSCKFKITFLFSIGCKISSGLFGNFSISGIDFEKFKNANCK